MIRRFESFFPSINKTAKRNIDSAICQLANGWRMKLNFFITMAHRKNPNALRRRINQSASTFCAYIRKNGLSHFWIKRLDRLQKTKHFTKCGLKTKYINKTIKGHSKTSKKVIYKKTNAVIYSYPFRATIYPVFSKGLSFKVRRTKRNTSKLASAADLKRKARLNRQVVNYIYFFYQAYKDVALYKINQNVQPF